MRSPRPRGGEATAPADQANDAAALLDGRALSPAAVFGTSSRGPFARFPLTRHPDAVRGAILHEPARFSLFDDPEGVRNTVGVTIRKAMGSGG